MFQFFRTDDRILSKPVLKKHSTDGGDNRVIYGASAMQGWRSIMEDVHTTTLNLERTNIPFFGVYDGFNGEKAAKSCGYQLHKRIAAEVTFKKGDYAGAIENGFLGTEADLKQDPDLFLCGSTAVVAIIEPGKRVIVGNAGDSKTVISVNGELEALSYDHQPNDNIEKARILAAGGFIRDNRVSCEERNKEQQLAMSRSIGCFKFKQNIDLSPEQQIMSSKPDVIERKLGKDEEFIVLASEGIWNYVSSPEVVDFIRRGIADEKPLVTISEELVDLCYDCGGHDNITVIIVGLLNGLTKEQWYDTIKKRVQQRAKPQESGRGLGKVET